MLDFSKGKGVIPVICSYIPNTILKLFMDSIFVDRLLRYSFFWHLSGMVPFPSLQVNAISYTSVPCSFFSTREGSMARKEGFRAKMREDANNESDIFSSF